MGVKAVSTVPQEGHGKVGTGNVDEASSSSSRLCSQRWLKSVAVQRLPVQSFGKRKWLKCVLVERVQLKVQGSKFYRPPCAPTAPTNRHLSRCEQKGLLTLIHAMRDENLFCCDIPSCILCPSHLLDVLESQLRSAVLWSACSPTPTGIALIHPPLTHERKNGVKRRSKSHHSCKVKKHKNLSCVRAEPEVEHESQQNGMEVAIAVEGAVMGQTSEFQLEPAFETAEQALFEGQQLRNHSEHCGSPLPDITLTGNRMEVVCVETSQAETCGVSGTAVCDEASYADTNQRSLDQCPDIEETRPPTDSSSSEMQECSRHPLSN